MVKLVGKQSNRNGVGARLRLTAGGKTQIRDVKTGSSYLSQSDLRQHFGLGRSTQADRLEIRWPSGKMDVLQNIAANAIVTVTEGEGVTGRVAFAGR
jgi:hypothetical protein